MLAVEYVGNISTNIHPTSWRYEMVRRAPSQEQAVVAKGLNVSGI
jgi:hypothetical protein